MSVKKAIASRTSTRDFIKGREIKPKQLESILVAGQLAPNGMGLEAWHFYVFDEQNKDELMYACSSQEMIGDSSVCIIITAPTEYEFKHNRAFYARHLVKKGVSEAKADFYINAVIERGATNYLREQSFFAASQMVLQAEELGIDSCIVGGYNRHAVEEVIGVDSVKTQAVLVIAFGFGKDKAEKKSNKRQLSEIVTYVRKEEE